MCVLLLHNNRYQVKIACKFDLQFVNLEALLNNLNKYIQVTKNKPINF